MTIASRVKPFLPPVTLPLIRSLVGLVKRPEWEYVPQGWRETDPRSEGWNHPSVVEAQMKRWPDFVAAVTGPGTLGVRHEAIQIESDNIFDQNIILSFAYVVGRTIAGRSHVSILDWGGGLGYYALIAQRLFPETQIDYTVEELPGICKAGRQLQPSVRFTQDGASLDRSYDLVFVSGAIQYARDWRDFLGRLEAAADRWVYLTRMPITDYDKSYVVCQRPYWAGYRTEYISWVLSRDELLNEAKRKMLLLEREFLVRPLSEISGAPSKVYERGLLFGKTQNQIAEAGR